MDWFDELDLDPAGHPVSMGTRSLGDRPWLVVDDRRNIELAEKRRLLAERRDEVAHLTEESRPAATAVVDLIESHGIAVGPGDDHPLERAALAAQDDLCLVHRTDDHWVLDASLVCFPTYWYLPEKVGHPIGVVHDPVGGYADRIADRVTRLFDRLTERPVWRRNWSVVDETALFQPARRTHLPAVPADRVMHHLHVRSERQTLRRVAPGWILFTIRVQMAPLAELLTTDHRRHTFRRWVEHVPPEIATKRRLCEAQRTELLAALHA